MKLKIIFICLFINILSCINLFSQTQMPDIAMPSPNIANLGSYGETPVSLYTGLPIIEIPIYTLSENNINLPIYLSYHAGGVQPDLHPGWVGLNWSLNAGGYINRVVKDLPDEYSNPNKTIRRNFSNIQEVQAFFDIFNLGAKGDHVGYYYTHNVNNGDNWNDDEVVNQHIENFDDILDTEPDKFSFNFLGYSGEFYLSDKGEWFAKSEQNVKIELIGKFDLPEDLQTSYSHFPHIYVFNGRYNIQTFSGFVLTTNDGFKYTFGNNTNSIEYSIPFFYQSLEEWIANTWYLTKITTPEGNSIELEYENDDYITNMYLSFDYKMVYYTNDKSISKDSLKNKETTVLQCFPYNSNSYKYGDNEWAVDWFTPRYASYTGNLIRTSYLTKIISNNKELTFKRENSIEKKYNNIYEKNKELYNYAISNISYSQFFPIPSGVDGAWSYLWDKIKINNATNEQLISVLKWQKLTNITIKNKKDDDILYSYEFNYNDKSSERLMLKSIQKTNLNIKEPPYKFEYYTSNNYELPDYLHESIDHWGFFNKNKTTAITRFRTTGFHEQFGEMAANYYLLRAPTTEVEIAELGTLKKITYPTGGYTMFEYEQNEYTNSLSFNRSYLNKPSNNLKLKTGGLRIKKIITNSELTQNKEIVKEYFYVRKYTLSADLNNLISSGTLSERCKYWWTNYNTQTNNNDITTIYKVMFSSQNLLPYSNNSNSSPHITYNEIVEKNVDGSYIIYKFSDFEGEDGNHFDMPLISTVYSDVTPYFPYIDRSNRRGKLITKEIYNANGKLVEKEKNTYLIGYGETIRALYLNAFMLNCFNNAYINLYNAAPYYIETNRVNLFNKEIYKYDINSNSVLNLSQAFFYNDKNLLKFTINIQSNDKAYFTFYTYPYEILKNYKYSYMEKKIMDTNNYNNLIYPFQILNKDFENKIDTIEIEKELNKEKLSIEKLAFLGLKELYNDDINTPIEIIKMDLNSNIISANLNLFTNVFSNTLKTALPFKNLFYTLTSPTNYLDYTFCYFNENEELVWDKNFVFDLNYDNYDNNGNILQVHKENNYSATYIWSYNNTLPVAEVMNADNTEIYYNGYEDDINQNSEMAYTGKYSIKFTSPNQFAGSKNFTNTDLKSDEYIYSAWINTTAQNLVMVANDGNWSGVQMPNTNGVWTYFERTIKLSDFPSYSTNGLSIHIFYF